MKKIKLYPTVDKTKGKKNWLLIDFLEEKIYRLAPDGDIDSLKKQLLNKGLAIETNGVIPFKMIKTFGFLKKRIILREVQIRVIGRCEDNCSTCGKICQCYKSKTEMEKNTLKSIIEQLKYLPIKRLVITGGNPFLKPELLRMIRNKIKADNFFILFFGAIGTFSKLIEENQFKMIRKKRENFISEEMMNTDFENYFYNKEYNPCWGHKVAIDEIGNIKPCLWSSEVLGNIKTDKLKKLILNKKFDPFWELCKDKIEVCQNCEFRYVCTDCRVDALKKSKISTGKTANCSYDPNTGKW